MGCVLDAYQELIATLYSAIFYTLPPLHVMTQKRKG